MTCAKDSLLRRMLCIVISLVLVSTVGWPAGTIQRAYADEPAACAPESEAQLAAEERSADPEELGYVPGEIVVVYEEGATESRKDEAAAVVEGERAPEEAVFADMVVGKVEISDNLTVETAAAAIAEDPAVKYAVPNYLAEAFEEATAAPSSVAISKVDELKGRQWYLDYVKASGAWKLLAANGAFRQSVKVGVIDTGAQLDHPDLADVIDRSRSFEVLSGSRAASLRGDGYTNGGTTRDEFSSHGTHVCGIIAAEADNGGIAGVASGGGTSVANKIIDLVVADAFPSLADDDNGNLQASADVEDIVFALRRAAEKGCSVVNMSLGFTSTDTRLIALFNEVIGTLVSKYDVVVVAAMGNNGKNVQCVPAVCDNVIAVASLSHRNQDSGWGSFQNATWFTGDVTRSAFSNYGSWCDLSAPGERVYSTYVTKSGANDYVYMDGTSMATPVVTAVAAMVRAANPGLSAAEVSDVLCGTATDLYMRGRDSQSGYGAVNAEAAVAAALKKAEETAKVGWELRNGKWYYWQSGGVLAKKWAKIQGAWYYFDSSGAMCTGWVRDGGSWYYLSSSGSMRTGWLQVGGKWYYLKPSGAMAVGWLQIEGVWYYLEQSGAMRIGWLQLGGSWYYLRNSGAMASGWQNVGGAWYYLQPRSGVMQIGWQKIGAFWYYLSGSGAMRTGWFKSGGSWYFLRDSGAMATGWLQQGGTWYYLSGSGAMVTGTRIIGGISYTFDSSGAMR